MAAQQSLLSIRDWIRYSVSRLEQAAVFFGHGTSNAYDESVWLVLRALHLPMDRLDDWLDARVLPDEAKHLQQLIQRRVEQRTPTAYLLREAWLRGYRFYVDERVIVPRSFIAELLDNSLQPWVPYPELIHSAADICTGSGCLGVLLAHAFPEAQIDVVDISPDAIAVANINIRQYALQDQVQAIPSDMFSALKGKRYDLIISNPPYVDAQAMAALPEEYRNEPQIALGSGADGLDHTHTLLAQAADYLHDEGLLVVEIGHNRAALIAAYPDTPFTWLEVEAGDQFVFLLQRADLPSLSASKHP